ncbi:MAG: DUF2971 domain-containing protein [Alphaproteobacteria bacterium]
MERPKHWLHDRTHFYKYMTADAAEAVLRSGHLRWSSPNLFNDPFDMQFDLHLEYDRRAVAERSMDGLWRKYSGQDPIVAGTLAGTLINVLQANVPGLSRDDFQKEFYDRVVAGLVAGDAYLPQLQDEVRSVLSSIRILCLSEVFDNMLMWAHYSQNHSGVVIRLSCLPERDSAWGAAVPVRYERRMPLLATEEDIIRLMSGDSELDHNAIFNKAVFTKAEDWSYEKEWRIVGGRDPQKDYEDIPFYSTELTGIYLGCNMRQDRQVQFRALVREKCSHCEIFLAKKSSRDFAMEFVSYGAEQR